MLRSMTKLTAPCLKTNKFELGYVIASDIGWCFVWTVDHQKPTEENN